MVSGVPGLPSRGLDEMGSRVRNDCITTFIQLCIAYWQVTLFEGTNRGRWSLVSGIPGLPKEANPGIWQIQMLQWNNSENLISYKNCSKVVFK